MFPENVGNLTDKSVKTFTFMRLIAKSVDTGPIGNALRAIYALPSSLAPALLGMHANSLRTEKILKMHSSTLGQKLTFYPEIPLILIFHKCEFYEK